MGAGGAGIGGGPYHWEPTLNNGFTSKEKGIDRIWGPFSLAITLITSQPEGSISVVCWNWLLLARESQLPGSLSNSMVSRYLGHGRSIYTMEIGKYYQSGIPPPPPLPCFPSTPLAYFEIIEHSCQDCYPPQGTCHRSHNRKYLANTPQHFFCAKHYTILQHDSTITLYYTLF